MNELLKLKLVTESSAFAVAGNYFTQWEKCLPQPLSSIVKMSCGERAAVVTQHEAEF